MLQYAMFYDQDPTQSASVSSAPFPVKIVSLDPDEDSPLPQRVATYDGKSLSLLRRPRPAKLSREDDYGTIVACRVRFTRFTQSVRFRSFQHWRDEVAELRVYRESDQLAKEEASRVRQVRDDLKVLLRRLYS